ncbi:MAG: diaminopimelate decarboxylase [Oscillatoriales cyanobacterium SM2_1_8]|nr:diaminopimelate decarboxylase [Oscillatoriales cyanobacterium SM2_1_8]
MTTVSPALSVLPAGDRRAPNQQIWPLTAATTPSGHLAIGGCDVVDLVARFGSPLYILDEATLRTACQQYRAALTRLYPQAPHRILYASKAWSCLAVCAIVAREGLYIDAVSAGEILTAIEAGVPGDRIYFHGNNKSPEELRYGLEWGVTVVADNWHDLHGLQAWGGDRRPRVMLRVTPGIECHTHEYIRTGHLDSKFGFDPNEMPAVLAFASQQNWEVVGLHAHIGSQIFELQAHRDIVAALLPWYREGRETYNLPFTELNVGGGLGIRYTETDDPPTIADWVEAVVAGMGEVWAGSGLPWPTLLCEPGRSLIGPACVTAYTVGSQKTVPGIRTYVAVDGGMSDNPRPITYQSRYSSLLANRATAAADTVVTVAGKHCESGDVLLRDALLPAPTSGDILVVASTGAYNASMASHYNRLPKIAAVVVADGEANLILRRETPSDLLRQDCLPDRLRG